MLRENFRSSAQAQVVLSLHGKALGLRTRDLFCFGASWAEVSVPCAPLTANRCAEHHLKLVLGERSRAGGANLAEKQQHTVTNVTVKGIDLADI